MLSVHNFISSQIIFKVFLSSAKIMMSPEHLPRKNIIYKIYYAWYHIEKTKMWVRKVLSYPPL